jgi:undecaprenyl diphosphate synthase
MEKILNLPRHIAFIMDGNGRWAEQRDLPRLEGHRSGVENLHPVVRCLNDYGVKYATIYAFSTENWNRPEDEVYGIMALLEEVIEEESLELHRNNVKIRHIGRRQELSAGLTEALERAEVLTQENTGLTLGVAFNYGGRGEIIDAIRRIIADGLSLEEITEELLDQYLYTSGFPDVDLVVRPGGELRTSNFMIWQSAYSEYYFTPVLWPDFDKAELDEALLAYSQRQRRFGRLQTKAACSERES